MTEKTHADTSLTDDELLARARGGEALAFRLLVERYEGTVAATVHGLLGNGADAEDVGQEVFVRFYRSLDRFRGEASLKTYLTRIAVNLSLNALRRRRRFWARFLPEDRFEDLEDATYEPDVEARDRAALVRAALERLAPPFRVVVVLRMIEGYSTRETAEILDLPLGTVLSRLARAQQKLKVLLTPYFDDET
ncbi:sigma-70 family RNA polymerase sigma factor [Rhodocaloribacter litoris]|uniref:RNA polymerase sigma factor n=1 Tax=Rhodocaloribacter litoris TaxID=2558931 RepID=UPI001422C3A4|nr:sigma-70 family RNA polymerase sigma factor [Rhodocaloribacter litoris]QXD14205.1 sigma-70 family RNA polymerase sigma factor [Rhodocaloribacter litoris]